jgi:hypothetical protein
MQPMETPPFDAGIVTPEKGLQIHTDWHFWGYGQWGGLRPSADHVYGPGVFSSIFMLSPMDRLVTPPFNRIDDPEAYLRGDSNYTIGDNPELVFGIDGKQYTVLFHKNAEDRLTAFQVSDFSAVNIGAAHNTSRSIFNMFSAWLGVYFHITLREGAAITFNKDRRETTVTFRTPYGTLPVGEILMKPFPVLWPFASLYSEGVRSNSRFYSFLCYFKLVHMFQEKIQPGLRKLVAAQNIPIEDLNGIIPSHPFRFIAPNQVGRKFNVIRKEYQSEFRNAIAHFDLGTAPRPFNPPDEDRIEIAEHVIRFIAYDLFGRLVRNLNTLQKAGVAYSTISAVFD